MKKYFVLFLSLAIMANIMSVPASALAFTNLTQESQSENIPDKVALRENPDGTYTLLSFSNLPQRTPLKREIIYASTERDMDILRLPSGQYLTPAYDNTYVISDRIDLNTSDFNANYPLFEKYDLSKESIQSAKDAIESQIALGNYDFEFSYYISKPFTIPSLSSTSSANNSNVIVTQTGEARNYMSEHVSISRGISTKNIADAIASLTITAIGAASTTFSIFSSGKSALDAFESYINRTVTVPLSSDWQQIQFKYDWLEKTASVRNVSHGNLVGCVAQKIWLNTVYYEQFYANYKNAVLAKAPNSNGVYKTSKYVNKVAKTKSWDDIERVALYNWTTPVYDQPLKVRIAGITYVFKKA